MTTWLPWLALPRGNGKIGKAPSLPRGGVLRPIDSRGAGVTLPEAHSLARQHGAGGVGVVLDPNLGLVVLDLDLPLTARAQTLLSTVPGYAESSPGGGVHVWLAGSLARNRRRAGIEVLGRGFVTVTGAALSGRGRALGTLPEVLEQVGAGEEPAPGARQEGTSTLADREVLQRLYAAVNGAQARRLLETGDWVALGYASASEADLAAARLLRFWCGADPQRLARLMQGTALRRPKWGQSGYLERTIQSALALGGPVWRPGAE